MARKFGASFTFNAKDVDLKSKVHSITHDRGADIVFEAVGIEATVNTAIENVRKGGAVTLVGNLASNISFPLQSVVTREIQVQGSCAIAGEYPQVLEMMEHGLIDVESLLSATAPLSEGASWFRRLYDKEPGLNKVVLQP